MFEELEKYKLTKYKSGTIIFDEGSTCNVVSFVKKGCIKIVAYTNNGDEILYNRIHSGDCFGESLLFSNNQIYQGDVIAEEDCELYQLTKSEILDLMQKDQKFLINYLSKISESNKNARTSIKILTFKCVEDRILYSLNISQGKITYKSISDLAKKLFVSRESLSRSLHKLENGGIIKISNKNIKLVDN